MKRTGTKLTLEEVLYKIKDRPYLSIDFSTYIDTKTKARFIDSTYGEFFKNPEKVFAGANHNDRSKIEGSTKRTTSIEEVKLKLANRPYLNIKEDTYTTIKNKADFVDSEYGPFTTQVQFVLRGGNHPIRGKKIELSKRSLSEDEVKIKLLNRPYLTLVEGTFKNTSTICSFLDAEHGRFEAIPGNIIYRDQNHPTRYANTSKGETELREFVASLSEIEPNKRFYTNGVYEYNLDIFVPSLNLGIEYDGVFWHSDKNKHTNYHVDKRQYFLDRGISVVFIRSDEWNYNKEVVKSVISNKLGILSNKIFARKCDIRKVRGKAVKDFYTENHLMGTYTSAKHYGLYYKDELLSLIGYHDYKDGLEISRFATKLNTVVPGGLSRLLSKIEEVNPDVKFIRSFVDLRYGDGSSLLKVGYSLNDTKDGWKWTDGDITFNRRRCRANMDSRKLTEKEYADILRIYKIHDCGQAEFIKYLIKS
jgi:hypothetical protein